MSQSSSPSKSAKAKKIPLVRAQLSGGGAVVGVRVRPECLQGVRYALDAMLKQASEHRAAVSEHGPEAASSAISMRSSAKPASWPLLPIQELSEHLEACLKKTSPDKLAGHGWGGAHVLLTDAGLVDGGAQGMLAAQEAVDHLETNGKVEIDKATGALTLLKKQKGCGWYIPPPKKPKTGRGRGRGRGRGGRRARAAGSAVAV